jgi:hypothetical protein
VAVAAGHLSMVIAEAVPQASVVRLRYYRPPSLDRETAVAEVRMVDSPNGIPVLVEREEWRSSARFNPRDHSEAREEPGVTSATTTMDNPVAQARSSSRGSAFGVLSYPTGLCDHPEHQAIFLVAGLD